MRCMLPNLPSGSIRNRSQNFFSDPVTTIFYLESALKAMDRKLLLLGFYLVMPCQATLKNAPHKNY